LAAGTGEDPRKSTTYRVLVVIVSILSVLILLAFAAMVALGVRQFSRHHASGPVFTTSSLSTQLPPGAKITSIETSGNRVVIGLHTPEGDEVDIFDTDTGRPVARIRAAAAPK